MSVPITTSFGKFQHAQDYMQHISFLTPMSAERALEEWVHRLLAEGGAHYVVARLGYFRAVFKVVSQLACM